MEWDAQPVSVNDEEVAFNIICPDQRFDETLHVPREEFDARAS